MFRLHYLSLDLTTASIYHLLILVDSKRLDAFNDRGTRKMPFSGQAEPSAKMTTTHLTLTWSLKNSSNPNIMPIELSLEPQL